MAEQCFQCHLKTVDQLIDKFNLSTETANSLLKEIKQLLKQQASASNPFLAAQIHRLASRKINCSTLYRDEKLYANEILLAHYDYWKLLVKESDNPMYMATKLAVAGNIIDYGAHTEPVDITYTIEKLLKQGFTIDECDVLFEKVTQAKKIIYLGDNAGEIVFDKLLIETMGHPNVTYVVRGKPVINDVTFEDAHLTGMDNLCKVISNGYDAPSTLLAHCSEDFLNEFKSADLIISKGQGNFEGLMNENDYPIFFLLMAKCKPIADLLRTEAGGIIAKGIGASKGDFKF